MKFKVNIHDCTPDSGLNTFETLLRLKENNIVRDTFILFSPENATRRLKVGYTVVYPKCRTNGHSHANEEEIYLVTWGRGLAQVGEEKFIVSAGDCFYVAPGLFHSVENCTNEPLHYVWAIAQI
ncbi:MAG: cupin domain-containing protein [Thermoanaerobacteraceae bacterium]|nr:cupin domain-containing protein [Thermoanaerobacteraceae bacterium]